MTLRKKRLFDNKNKDIDLRKEKKKNYENVILNA